MDLDVPDELVTHVAGLAFPEGPRWRSDGLWFSDIHGHRVLRLGLDGRLETVVSLDDRPSGLGFLADGTLLISSILDRRLLAFKDGELRVHADIAPLVAGFINDMVVDARGFAYVGARNGGAYGSATDSVILVRPDGSFEIAAEAMVSPNGSAVTPDGKFLIVAETALGRLTRFRIQDDGALTDREVMAQRPGHAIDGICLDAEGGVWCGGGRGAFLLSATGEVLREIANPGRTTLAPALGGPDGRTLFLATTDMTLHDNIMRVGSDRALDATVSSDGRIEAVRVTTPGIQAP